MNIKAYLEDKKLNEVLEKELSNRELETLKAIALGFDISEISKSLKVMPVAKIAQDVHHITQALNKSLPPLMEKMTNTLDTVDDILLQNKNNTAQMVKEIGEAAQSFDALIDNNANNISQMIDSFNAAASSMKNLTDYLQMYPNAIITGKEY